MPYRVLPSENESHNRAHMHDGNGNNAPCADGARDDFPHNEKHIRKPPHHVEDRGFHDDDDGAKPMLSASLY